MDAFLASLGLVSVAEMGDKTQLLAFVLAARFARQRGAIIAGILVATLANHLGAAFVGHQLSGWLDPQWMRWGLGLAFLGFALWALVPDRLDEGATRAARHGAFLTTLLMFFIAEMGDKTQFATVALGARYADWFAVTLGTTLGMMVANVPAVLLGHGLAQRVPLHRVRFVAAALFAAFGVMVLLGVDLGLDVPATR